MKSILILFALLFTSPGCTRALCATSSNDWKALFNGRNLVNWNKFLATPQGAEPLVANQDPKNVFSITNLEGENVIRVSGEGYGGLTTQEEFENFHFRVQFKWGLARWGGRSNVGRDSGILYCGIGQPHPRTGWLTSIENNVMEKGVGQWWSVNGAIIDCEGEWITPENELYVPYKKEGSGEKNIVWRQGGPRITAHEGNGITPPFDVEWVFGNWNTAEVIFWAGQCIHILNGHVNLVAFNPRYNSEGRWIPFTKGKIQLQSEEAEVFFRRPEVRTISEVPAEYSTFLVSPAAGEEGFTSLLSPASLKEWKQCGPGRFAVSGDVVSGEGGMGLWWFTARQYTNFVIRGEFLQEENQADSGVFIRFPNPENGPWNAVRNGHEIEIGDPKPEKPTWRTGSIYPFHPSMEANTKPAGQWNSYEIVCMGQNYSVRINGKIVNTWTDSSKRSESGFIGLQNYADGKTVRHRNLRVKELL
jgi:hypothetical protein